MVFIELRSSVGCRNNSLALSNLVSSCSEAPVRSHLKTVYVYLTMSVLSATAGAYLHMVNGLFWNFGLLGALASMGLVMGLHFTPDNGKNRGQRTAMLLGFAFLSGACIHICRFTV